jgi:hypothetical protein
VGELTLAEQNAVLLESLTLDALGVRSGDEVKLTCVAKVSSGKGGSPVKVARVTKTVKAYAEDGYIRTIRATPKFNPRTDFVREPQTDLVREKGTLPSVWMGEGLRQQLGLIDQPPSKDEPKAGTAAKSQPWGAKAEPKARTADKSQPWGANAVLVSPSKRFVIVDHFREAALVAALGLVGVAGSISEPVWLKMSVLVSAVVLPLALILWRIRTRLR